MKDDYAAPTRYEEKVVSLNTATGPRAPTKK